VVTLMSSILECIQMLFLENRSLRIIVVLVSE